MNNLECRKSVSENRFLEDQLASCEEDTEGKNGDQIGSRDLQGVGNEHTKSTELGCYSAQVYSAGIQRR